jgi:hypothetical protein
MKKYCVFLINLLAIVNLCAQQNPSVEKKLFKINLLAPGIAYEIGLDSRNTLNSEFDVGFGYRFDSKIGKGWYFFPAIEEQFRHYYNLEKRKSKDKSTKGNSGNYVGALANYTFKSLTTNENLGYYNPSFTLGAVWGLQRTYKHNFNINLNLGLGHVFQKNVKSDPVAPIVNFSLGWVIGK